MPLWKTRETSAAECRRETSYTLKKIKINQTIREKKYTFEITAAFCNECGGEMGIPGLMDYNIKEIDERVPCSADIKPHQKTAKCFVVIAISKKVRRNRYQ